jgi:S1-C subfamily serine protease
VDGKGTTVTNAHVGLGARVAMLEFADGRQVLAKRRGIDLERDLAVYEPEQPLASPAPCFELAPARPSTGEWLVGLGYPGGPRGDLRPTVSLGQCVPGEGIEMPVMGFLSYKDTIRTDLAIFSGNSGGPLVDLEGRLVGINGAIQPNEGAAFAVPVDVVRDRLLKLKNGALLFPGGRVLDASNPLVQAIDKVMEPLARQMVPRVREGFAANPGSESAQSAEKDTSLTGERDALARILRGSERSKSLVKMVNAGNANAAVFVDAGKKIIGTRVSRRHVVAKASLVGTSVSGGKIVARAPEHDLALIELSDEADVRLPEDAPARPEGSVVGVMGPDGVRAGGIMSVGARAIPEGVSMRISAGGQGETLLNALKSIEKLADRLGSEELKQLIAGIRSQLEVQGLINKGNEPRGYARVASHDAPLAPSEAGAPLVDADGRLVGVNVANSNYGTSYVVPIAVVRAAFEKQLGPARQPATLGKAKLY